MELHNLKPAKGSVNKSKRKGRGQGSGKGGTATKGHKGAQSRSGYSRKRGFEGGQMPLQRRVPKRGFNNINRVEYLGLNLDTIQKLVDKHGFSEVSIDLLREAKIVKKTDRVKVLGRGELKKGMTFKVHAFSDTAKERIESAGGSCEIIK